RCTLARASTTSEPVALLDQFPVGVLVQDLVAAKLVEVAAAIVELLAVRAGAGHHPHRDGAGARDERVHVVPAHISDDAEAVGEYLAHGGLAAHTAPFRLRSPRHQEGAVLGEKRHDAVDIAAVERRIDLLHELGRRPRCHGSTIHHVRASAALTRSGVIGTRRMRTPVASKIALAIAAGTVRVAGSPAPVPGSSGRLMSTTSICSGASWISRIG